MAAEADGAYYTDGEDTPRVREKEILSLAELDRLAANTGCSEHDDCLTCPLSRCIYETVRGRISVRTEQRRGKIRETGMWLCCTCHNMAEAIDKDLDVVYVRLKAKIMLERIGLRLEDYDE